jgi:formylglycine-generating enzyme
MARCLPLGSFVLASLLATLLLGAQAAAAVPYLPLPGGVFRSVLPADGKSAAPVVAPFLMRATPVSNAQFRDFVAANPQWRRDQAATIVAAPGYLSAWSAPLDHAPLAANAPVTHVSWHAAAAFCASEGGRLPRWYEWEFAAAADEARPDARDDPAWLARILAWYARPGTAPPQAIGLAAPNVYGLYDIHGLVWEWVEDFSGLFVNADSRVQGDRKQLDFCGGAAVSLADRRNYAVLMRLALLAAMEAEQEGANLGFRCVRDPATKGSP